MKALYRIAFVAVLLLALFPATPANSAALPLCTEDTPYSGGVFRLCVPPVAPLPPPYDTVPTWNHDLIVYAHGYVDPTNPALVGKIPEDQLYLKDGSYFPSIALGLGYAFATTSYRETGLAVKSGLVDVVTLVQMLKGIPGVPGLLPGVNRIYILGVSEGGLITTLAIEKYGDLFTGGLAACGPIGDSRRQGDYFTDFRVLFDYFYPGLLPPSPISIPDSLIANWDTTVAPAVAATMLAPQNANKTRELLRVAMAPVDPAQPATVPETILGLLDYNIVTTNDAQVKLGGQPYGNMAHWYFGSSNDWKLNRDVQRFSATPAAIREINANYQTSGRLPKPLVTLHTTGDPFDPFWHEVIYAAKAWSHGYANRMRLTQIPIVRYGHCTFNTQEALAAFSVLLLKTGSPLPANVAGVLSGPAAVAEYTQRLQQFRTAQNRQFLPQIVQAAGQ